MKFFSDFKKNISVLKKELSSDDIDFIDITLSDEKKGCLIFIKNLVDNSNKPKEINDARKAVNAMLKQNNHSEVIMVGTKKQPAE